MVFWGELWKIWWVFLESPGVPPPEPPDHPEPVRQDPQLTCSPTSRAPGHEWQISDPVGSVFVEKPYVMKKNQTDLLYLLY